MKGFTLLESMMAAGVALVMGVFLVSILVNNTGLFYQESSIVNEGLSLNDVLDKVNSTAKEAISVAASYPSSSPTYFSSANVLILKLPALSINGVITDTYDYAVFYPDTNKPKVLRKKVFPDTSSTRKAEDLILTTILDSITFDYLDKNNNPVSMISASKIKTNLSVLSKTGSVGSKRSSSIITSLRNTP